MTGDFSFPEFRTGIGYDVHRLTPGRRLVIGGVEIPYQLGLLGHSDADVLLHAMMDAMLGAASLGDIGMHFPDSDPRYSGVSSLLLLKDTAEMLEEAGYRVVNIDSVIIAQKPKMAPHIPKMRAVIAQVLGAEEERIHIKATTEEGLGFTGHEEGIAAAAVCMLVRRPEEA